MVYESLLVFGVIFFVSAVHDIATQSKQASMHQWSRELLVFLTCGLYFTYFWRKKGQTLAMQTWRIKLVNGDGGPIPLPKAMVRYCLAWMWFLPGFVLASKLGYHDSRILIPIFACFLIWASLSLFTPDRQFPHDFFAKTRLIQLPLREANTAESGSHK